MSERMKKTVRIFSLILLIILLGIAAIHFSIIQPGQNNRTPENVTDNTAADTGETLLFRKYNLENSAGLENVSTLTDKKAASGRFSCKVDKNTEYGICIVYPVKEIPHYQDAGSISISAAVWSEDTEGISWVIEINRLDGSNIAWMQEPFGSGKHFWDTLNFNFSLTGIHLNDSMKIKMYPWNNNHKEAYIDNISVRIFSISPGRMNFDSGIYGKAYNYFNDLENWDNAWDKTKLSTEKSHSGHFSSVMKGSDSYSVSFIFDVDSVTTDTLNGVGVSVWVYPEEADPDITLVMVVRDPLGNNLLWKGKSSGSMHLTMGNWQKINEYFEFSGEDKKLLDKNNKLVFYVWSKNKGKVFADDFTIVFRDVNEAFSIRPFSGNESRITCGGSSEDGIWQFSYFDEMTFHKGATPSESTMSGALSKNTSFYFNPVLHGDNFLVSYADNQLIFHTWCMESKTFRPSGKTVFPGQTGCCSSAMVMNSGTDKSPEIILSGEKTFSIYRMNDRLPRSCSDTVAAVNMTPVTSGNNPAGQISVFADFNLDGQVEWLRIDSLNGSWRLFVISGNEPVQISEGKFPQGFHFRQEAITYGKFGDDWTENRLVCFDIINNRIFTTRFNQKSKEFFGIQFYTNGISFLRGSDTKLIRYPGENGTTDRLLIYNNGDRYSLLEGVFQENRLCCAFRIAFRGLSDPGRNPQFSERANFIPVKIPGISSWGLLSVSDYGFRQQGGESGMKRGTEITGNNSVQLFFPETKTK